VAEVPIGARAADPAVDTDHPPLCSSRLERDLLTRLLTGALDDHGRRATVQADRPICPA
jgi:hypothetical protein